MQYKKQLEKYNRLLIPINKGMIDFFIIRGGGGGGGGGGEGGGGGGGVMGMTTKFRLNRMILISFKNPTNVFKVNIAYDEIFDTPRAQSPILYCYLIEWLELLFFKRIE